MVQDITIQKEKFFDFIDGLQINQQFFTSQVKKLGISETNSRKKIEKLVEMGLVEKTTEKIQINTPKGLIDSIKYVYSISSENNKQDCLKAILKI